MAIKRRSHGLWKRGSGSYDHHRHGSGSAVESQALGAQVYSSTGFRGSGVDPIPELNLMAWLSLHYHTQFSRILLPASILCSRWRFGVLGAEGYVRTLRYG